MTQLVESLKRLYEKEKISEEKLQIMIKKSTITDYEYHYIIGKV